MHVKIYIKFCFNWVIISFNDDIIFLLDEPVIVWIPKCETALDNDYVTSDEGKKVQVSVCPNGHGKIKSPTCCGADMDCKG